MKRLFILLASVLLVAACSKKKEPTTVGPSGMDGSGEAMNPRSSGDQVATPTATDEGRPSFGAIQFEFDSDELTQQARGTLERVATYLQANPQAKLTLEGHADEQGADEYNVALGDRRARTARDYLTRLGVEQGRVRVVSYGEARPVGDDAANRRDEFVLRYGDAD